MNGKTICQKKMSGENNPMKGREVKEETRKKMRDNNLDKWQGENNPNYKKDMTGTNNPAFGIKQDNSSSQYFGVCIKRNGKYIYWTASIKVNGKRKNIGNFKLEKDAADAYNNFVIKNALPHPLNIF